MEGDFPSVGELSSHKHDNFASLSGRKSFRSNHDEG